jgi:hypothetical protein
VLSSDGETRTSFIHRHTFRENPSTSGVTVLISTIKEYKLHGLSETADNGFVVKTSKGKYSLPNDLPSRLVLRHSAKMWVKKMP